MKKVKLTHMIFELLLVFLVSGNLYGGSDICESVHKKPVLSLQQVTQAEFVHYIVVLSGMEAPSPQGMKPGKFYELEVEMLIDAGYPPAFAEIEPGRLVTRRYFASVMYQIALETDKEFARKHGGLTDETEQLRALVENEWLYAEKGRLYREDILSVLCTHDIRITPKPAIEAAEIAPLHIIECSLETEAPVSPI